MRQQSALWLTATPASPSAGRDAPQVGVSTLHCSGVRLAARAIVLLYEPTATDRKPLLSAFLTDRQPRWRAPWPATMRWLRGYAADRRKPRRPSAPPGPRPPRRPRAMLDVLQPPSAVEPSEAPDSNSQEPWTQRHRGRASRASDSSADPAGLPHSADDETAKVIRSQAHDDDPDDPQEVARSLFGSNRSADSYQSGSYPSSVQEARSDAPLSASGRRPSGLVGGGGGGGSQPPLGVHSSQAGLLKPSGSPASTSVTAATPAAMAAVNPLAASATAGPALRHIALLDSICSAINSGADLRRFLAVELAPASSAGAKITTHALPSCCATSFAARVMLAGLVIWAVALRLAITPLVILAEMRFPWWIPVLGGRLARDCSAIARHVYRRGWELAILPGACVSLLFSTADMEHDHHPPTTTSAPPTPGHISSDSWTGSLMAVGNVLALMMRSICSSTKPRSASMRGQAWWSEWEPPANRSARALAVLSLISALALDLAVGFCMAVVIVTTGGTWLESAASALSRSSRVLQDGIVWIADSPAGLKLNTEMSLLLGGVALRVIEGWDSGIALVATVVKGACAAAWPTIGATTVATGVAAVVFMCGAAFALAVASDVVMLLTTHVWMLQVVMAQGHGWVLHALSALYYLFQGRKFNPLRQRIDTLDVTGSGPSMRLLVGTLLFATLLLVAPTVVTFYVLISVAWAACLAVLGSFAAIRAVLCDAPFAELVIRVWAPELLPRALAISTDPAELDWSRLATRASVGCWTVRDAPSPTPSAPALPLLRSQLHLSLRSVSSSPVSLLWPLLHVARRLLRHYAPQTILTQVAQGNSIPAPPDEDEVMLASLAKHKAASDLLRRPPIDVFALDLVQLVSSFD